jgi:predicted nucleic acid-binding protein
MTFADIPPGQAVFVDANTLVYHYIPHPTLQSACTALLERIARQEINGFSSTAILSDVAHRVMTMEAIAVYGWPAAGIANRLRRHPTDVQKLGKFRQAVDDVPKPRYPSRDDPGIAYLHGGCDKPAVRIA